MKVEVGYAGSEIRYAIEVESGDRREVRRDFSSNRESLRLVGDRWRAVLPTEGPPPHPDLHAAAIFMVLRPWVGPKLQLPFAVSRRFADTLMRLFSVSVTPVDETLSPRTAPESPRPALMFSGGVDSVAASLALPPEAVHLFLDRFPRPDAEPSPEALIDLVHQRAICDVLRGDGREVHRVVDDHEALARPYPTWHSEMSLLPAFYLADKYDLSLLDTGDVMGVVYMRGYRPEGGAQGWGVQPFDHTQLPEHDHAMAEFARAVGIERRSSLAGLSEVGTSKLVHHSPYRGRTTSCYYPSDGPFCMSCDKCFKKLLIHYILDDEEVPEELIDGFLAFPYLRGIFSGGYFDWHHIWFWIFQRVRTQHWFFADLQRQAQAGPDLSLLERWYPGARPQMAEPWREHVETVIAARIGVMSDEEVARFESLQLPPLETPQRAEIHPVPAGTPEGEESDAEVTEAHSEDSGEGSEDENDREPAAQAAPKRPEVIWLQHRPETLHVRFVDRQRRLADLTFFIGTVEEGEQVFRRRGSVGMSHAPARQGKAFHAAADALDAALRLVDDPPGPHNRTLWERAILSAVGARPIGRRFHCEFG